MKDTLEFIVPVDIPYTDKYIYHIKNDSMKIAVADTAFVGDLITVRISSFLWNNTYNIIGGTFVKLK